MHLNNIVCAYTAENIQLIEDAGISIRYFHDAPVQFYITDSLEVDTYHTVHVKDVYISAEKFIEILNTASILPTEEAIEIYLNQLNLN